MAPPDYSWTAMLRDLTSPIRGLGKSPDEAKAAFEGLYDYFREPVRDVFRGSAPDTRLERLAADRRINENNISEDQMLSRLAYDLNGIVPEGEDARMTLRGLAEPFIGTVKTADERRRAKEVGIAKDEFVTSLVSKLGSYAPEALSYDDYSAGLRGFLPSLTDHFSRNLPDTRAETMAREQKLGNVDTSMNSVPQLMTVLKQAAEAKKQQEAVKSQEIDSRLQQLMNQSEKGTQVYTADSTGITGRGEGQNADGKLGGGTFSKTPGRGFGGGGATQGLQEAFKVLTSLGVDANQAKRIVLSQVLPEGIRKGAEGAFNRMEFSGLDNPAKLEEIFMKLMKTDGSLADKQQALKLLARLNQIPPEEVDKFFPSKKP